MAGAMCAASSFEDPPHHPDEQPINFPFQDMIDATNGTNQYGTIVNSTRLVLRLDNSQFAWNRPWSGVESALVHIPQYIPLC